MTTEAIVILSLIGLGLVIITFVSNRNYNLNSIQSKRVGQGQHGTARFATPHEVKRTYRLIPYNPEVWRKQGVKTPSQGVIVGYQKKHRSSIPGFPSFGRQICF